MEEWKEYKIGDVCSKVCSGGTPSSKHSEYYDGDIPWLNTKEINFNRIYRTEKCITEEGLKNSSAKWIKENSVIVAMYGATAGKTAIAKVPLTTNQACCNLTITPSVADYRFVYYYLCYKFVELASLANGGAQQNLNAQIIKDFEIFLPSLQEQKQIANILSSLDDKIEVNRKINENLEQQAQALFKSWFVDFEPFKNGEFVESELGMIPKGWRVGSIYDYIDVVYGAPYKSSLFNDKKEGLPLIRIRDLKTNAPQFYTPEILPNTEFVKAGDIVAGMDAEFIPYVWLGEKGVLNQRCCKFRGKNEAISNYYILFLIKPELEYVQSYKTGTTVSHLGKSDIDRFRFVTPPLDVVKSFSDLVDGMLKELVNRANESRRLAELRDTLLPKLMSGELNMGDVML
ncbi:MAG: restriction endonuclease subunit S [Bacteroidaceae bacterium]|nr:restriction endonuclease subunit S [Bacteroidaceae bacterium]